FVHACGLTDGTRSHFEAMAMMERGVTGAPRGDALSGWLSRYIERFNAGKGSGLLPAISGNLAVPQSLLGYADAMPIADAGEFRFQGSPEQLTALKKLYAGDHALQQAGLRTLRAFDIVQSKIAKGKDGDALPYKPENNATYGDSDIARSLQSVAQLIKMDMGL